MYSRFTKFAFLAVIAANAFVDIAHKILLQNIAFVIYDGASQVIWVSIINALILIPFLLLFSFSGFLSDRYDKKLILMYGGVSSFILSIVMVVAYLYGDFIYAMVALLLLAAQSAIYSPAKFALVLELYGKKHLSNGNASVQAVSIIAILSAIGISSYIFESFYNINNLSVLSDANSLLSALTPLSVMVVPIAFLEMVISIWVFKRYIGDRCVNKNAVLDIKSFATAKLLANNIKLLHKNQTIWLSVIGLGVFWAVSQGMIAVFPAYAKEYLGIKDVFVINGTIALSGVGIALGSIFYTRISRHFIELGAIVLSSIAMAISIFSLTVTENTYMLMLAFGAFGFFGGMFIVPLNSLIQFNAKNRQLGTILAGNNWVHSLAMFLMLGLTTAVAYYGLSTLAMIYLILSIIIIGSLYTLYKLPQAFMLIFLKFFVGMRYKLEVEGIKNIPSGGGVLFLGNHISWIDWAIILSSVPRGVRFVVYKPIYEKWYLMWLFKLIKAIAISGISSKSSIESIAQALDNGECVVLFPEGAISRNGHLGEFKRGFEKILELSNNEVRVVPFYIRGLWESMFSRANKKFQKAKKTNTITVCFGTSMSKDLATAEQVKKDVFELSSLAWQKHIAQLKPLNEVIFDSLLDVGSNSIFSDSTGLDLTGDRFLHASILFKNLLKNNIKDEKNVAILLPSSGGGAFINYTMLMMGKVAININYSASIDSLKKSLDMAEVKTIITSRAFVSKLETKSIAISEIFTNKKVYYTEDLRSSISKIDAIAHLLCVKLAPKFILKWLHLSKVSKDDTALILFSSGSEGDPKGVMLSGDNILANAQQIANIVNADEKDVVLSSLPLFHAFGIVVTTFMPLIEGIKCVAHPDPTDGLGIAKLTLLNKATIMCGTSTFFRLYTKNTKIHPLMFESLRIVISGAEKLREDVRFEFKKRFGKNIYEGYGTTETSPVASCNLPDYISDDFEIQTGHKIGTVGMAIPGTTIKIVDPNSFVELETAQEGMVIITGVQVMQGYLKNSQKSNEVLKVIDNKTYYITGDKGRLDADGFLTIVDRYSRFAKIGGEMVSLGSIEEQISKILNDDAIDFTTTTMSDEKKGEKVILLISNIDDEKLQELKKSIIDNFTNNLMIPSDYKIVDEIPKLGSGKVDFASAKKMVS